MSERRPIPGFPDYYVSSSGEVWSCRNGTMRSKKLTKATNGYLVTGLMSPIGMEATKTVHELVLSAWSREKVDGECARHLNGDKTDNRIENLAWGSYSENNTDIVRHGRCAKAKLTPEQVLEIRARYVKGKAPNQPGNAAELATEYKVSKSLIHTISRGEVWGHL